MSMKIPFLLLALAVSAPTYATPIATPVEEAAAVPSLRLRFNEAVEKLRARAQAGGAKREDYQAVADALKSAAQAYQVPPTSVFVTDRLLARILELESMAQQAMYDLLELDILKDQAIDAELEYVLMRIKTGIAAKRQPSRTDWDAVYASLTARADAAKSWNPEIDAIIGRLRAEIDALMAKSKAGPLGEKDVDTAIDIGREARGAIVLTRIEKRGMEKKAVPADYGDVLDVAKRFPMPKAEVDDLVRKVGERLDEIRAAVADGRITREQFAKLRDLLAIRARAASSPK